MNAYVSHNRLARFVDLAMEIPCRFSFYSQSVRSLFPCGSERVSSLTIYPLDYAMSHLIYGPDLRIPYASTAFVTKRSTIAKRPQVMANYMRAMAEASKVMHTDREFVYKVLGKNLRITDRSILGAAYNAEIKALEPRLSIREESLQAILEDMAQTDPRAKRVKSQDLVDTRYLDDMEKSGFFDQLWAKR